MITFFFVIVCTFAQLKPLILKVDKKIMFPYKQYGKEYSQQKKYVKLKSKKFVF